MTHPSSPQAPMTAEMYSIERIRRAQILEPVGAQQFAQHTYASDIRALLEQYDALTARVATLESELAAAREVEDGEVVRLATMLRRFGERSGDECGKEFIQSADLLTLLSAALKEAERLLSHRTKDMQRWIDHHDARADAAEAKLEQAEEKICQAYQIVGSLAHETNTFDVPAVQRALDYLSGDAFDANFLPWSIRALQTKDTTE